MRLAGALAARAPAGRVVAALGAQTPIGQAVATTTLGGTRVPAGGLAAGAVALALGAGALVALATVMAIAGAGFSAPELPGAPAPGGGVSALALREIPSEYLHLYEAAAAHYGLSWAVLAGIGKVECDHGRDPDSACTQEGAVNSAGAGGPMQFVASTWAVYGVDGEGQRGPPDRWNPADAIYGAANYLRASGAPRDYRRAIYAYNHAWWYVAEVESWARRYSSPPVPPATMGDGGAAGASEGAGASGAAEGDGEGGDGEGLEGADTRLASETDTPVRFIPGERAELDPGDGHVALIPAGVPPVVQAMLVAGDELEELPYGPGGHPDPLGAAEEDCSSTVSYVLYRAGVRPLREIVEDNPLAQDYVHWGARGPGRWVTIYATDVPTPHVFIVIAGLRLDTSHDGTDEGPNRDENGPRWRILPHIPTWAHWSVRHPPGL
jgi:Transglycosylase SLT domain